MNYSSNEQEKCKLGRVICCPEPWGPRICSAITLWPLASKCIVSVLVEKMVLEDSGDPVKNLMQPTDGL